jgi:hypothetical protein
MQCACTVLACVICLAVQLYIFSHLINCTIFGKKVIEHKMYVLILTTNLSETFLILRTERDIINVCWSSCKVPDILIGF